MATSPHSPMPMAPHQTLSLWLAALQRPFSSLDSAPPPAIPLSLSASSAIDRVWVAAAAAAATRQSRLIARRQREFPYKWRGFPHLGLPKHHRLLSSASSPLGWGLMGRESSGDPGSAGHSSIALLQERFRQLQRAKEMREEREHLRGFATLTEHRGSGCLGERRPQGFLHPELVRPSRPLHASRALLSELDAERAGFLASGTVGSMGLWPERPAGRSMSSSDAKDVDTSLHL